MKISVISAILLMGFSLLSVKADSKERYLYWGSDFTLKPECLTFYETDSLPTPTRQYPLCFLDNAKATNIILAPPSNQLSIMARIPIALPEGRSISVLDYKFFDWKTKKITGSVYPKVTPIVYPVGHVGVDEFYAWSPNGRYFAFRAISPENPIPDRYVYDTVNNILVSLPPSGGSAERVFWSPDSQLVISLTTVQISSDFNDYHSFITITRLSTGRIEKTIDVTSLKFDEPLNVVCQLLVSPDNHSIAFTTSCGDGIDRIGQVFTWNSDLDRVTQITQYLTVPLSEAIATETPPGQSLPTYTNTYSFQWQTKDTLSIVASAALIANRPPITYIGNYSIITDKSEFSQKEGSSLSKSKVFNPNTNQFDFYSDFSGCAREWSPSGQVQAVIQFENEGCSGSMTGVHFESNLNGQTQTVRIPLIKESKNMYFRPVGWVVE